ncbi:MAG: phosphatase PAP2 family protein [Chloroflexota bacterium]
MNLNPEPLLPPEAPSPHFWSIYRRPVFLASLITGLVVFFIWLPSEARMALVSLLLAQQLLMSMLLLFALIVLSLVWAAGQRMDIWVFQFFNLRGYHPKWLDRIMWLVTQAGNMVTAFLLAGVFFVLNYRRLAVEVILGTITLWLLVETIKALTDRARPFLDIVGARVIGWRERGRSFPSGHTTQTFFLATLLIQRFQLGVGGAVILYAVAALVGFTRMYVGAHYPRDVIGGAVLGSVWGVLAILVDPYWFGLRF